MVMAQQTKQENIEKEVIRKCPIFLQLIEGLDNKVADILLLIQQKGHNLL